MASLLRRAGIVCYIASDAIPIGCDETSWRSICMRPWVKALFPISPAEHVEWSSFLCPRDLACYDFVNETSGVEVYNPQLVANQFGLVQSFALPYIWSLNDDWSIRPSVDPKTLESIFRMKIPHLYHRVWRYTQRTVTLSFDAWWKKSEWVYSGTLDGALTHFKTYGRGVTTRFF